MCQGFEWSVKYIHIESGIHAIWDAVFEIKGAPCTRCAHFPKFSTSLYRKEPIQIVPGAWILLHMHPLCAQNKALISNTGACFAGERKANVACLCRFIDILIFRGPLDKKSEGPTCFLGAPRAMLFQPLVTQGP